MGARNNSEAAIARADSRAQADIFGTWRERTRQIDWIPWLIVALGAFLRLLFLAMKPPHFDEGINGWFVDQMTKNGFYRYDPTNYHGPLHFYILFLSEALLGRNLWALRLPVVIGSIFCLRLTFKFEPFVGRDVTRWAALAMAVSPGFVFYGRYAIHEVWLLLFSMLFTLGLLGLWRKGTATYLWCVVLGASGMVLTKETYIIHVGCAVIAAFVTWLSHRLTKVPDATRVRQTWTYLDLAVAVAVGLAAIIFFYSGTFFNWGGLKGLYQTFDAWFKTGQNGNGHEKPPYYWLRLIGRYELPVALGLIACAGCQLFRNLSLRFLAIYGVGVLAAYSIVRYKTPWCIISVVWPFLFLFGAATLLLPSAFRRIGNVVLGLVVLVSLGLSISLNYFRCTTDTEPYVYVQTYNDIYKLTKPVLELARRDPVFYQLTGHFIRTSAYPLPWIFGDFPRIGYYEHSNLPEKLDADFLLVQEDRIAEVEPKLHGSYYTTPLTIRPYQDTSKLYLNAKVFSRFFHGHVPDFAGKGAP
ncbi:MAG: TIGR03663 family protein [Verrucomicrobiota bacterium]|nr:TIGR03663 family protein [Verrucomicrobiota bacterium]